MCYRVNPDQDRLSTLQGKAGDVSRTPLRDHFYFKKRDAARETTGAADGSDEDARVIWDRVQWKHFTYRYVVRMEMVLFGDSK